MQEVNKKSIYNILSCRQNLRLKLVVQGMAVGVSAGLLVVAYRFLLETADGICKRTYIFLSHMKWMIPLWFIALIVMGYILGWLVKKESMASGSGVPQLEGILLRQLDMNWWRVIIVRFLGGVLAIAAGLSLGRGGPSIQIGAAAGQGLSRLFRDIKIEEKYIITGGASAGLAAAFNAPIAGVVFVLEEVYKHFSPLIMLSTLTASLTADFISKYFFGIKPMFYLENQAAVPLNNYFYVVGLGVVAGMCGVLFNKILLEIQELYSNAKWLLAEFRPILPLIAAGVLGMVLPQVLGSGSELITSLFQGGFTLKVLIVLLAVKFIFTMLSCSCGAPGGIFLPLLAVGALTGSIYGHILSEVFNMNGGYINNFIVLGMAGCFAAIVKAPITGSILVIEMTGSFHHLLSAAIVSVVAYIVADILHSGPIYESMLNRILRNNKSKFIGDEKASVVLEIAVSLESKLDGKRVRDIDWPEKCLLVGIKRGEKEAIPKGDTEIFAGDFLIVLAGEQYASCIGEQLSEMAAENYPEVKNPIPLQR